MLLQVVGGEIFWHALINFIDQLFDGLQRLWRTPQNVVMQTPIAILEMATLQNHWHIGEDQSAIDELAFDISVASDLHGL